MDSDILVPLSLVQYADRNPESLLVVIMQPSLCRQLFFLLFWWRSFQLRLAYLCYRAGIVRARGGVSDSSALATDINGRHTKADPFAWIPWTSSYGP